MTTIDDRAFCADLPPLELAFWQRAGASTSDGCWLWTGNTDGGKEPRGRVRHGGKVTYAYRAAYEYAVGPIPAGLHACHRCDTPLCVRPSHLFIGTALENMRDAAGKGRLGHPGVSGEAHHNVKVSDEVVRACREAYAQGVYTHAELAEIVGAAKTVVGNWVRGNTRADAGGPLSSPGCGNTLTRRRAGVSA